LDEKVERWTENASKVNFEIDFALSRQCAGKLSLSPTEIHSSPTATSCCTKT
tara:strand:+ start:338 stop:493 length:156 start_codon:yes stop_codon:yes gene_type:complete